jgi:hypothetical protein
VGSNEKVDEIITGAFEWIHAARSPFPFYIRKCAFLALSFFGQVRKS